MKTVRSRSRLLRAIKLREWTHRAIDADDAAGDDGLTHTRRLNRIADEAVRSLSPEEMLAFMEWAQSGADAPRLKTVDC